METIVEESAEPKTRRNRIRLFIGQLSWRMILMRLVINGLTLMLVALLVPDIYFVDRTLLSIVLMAAVLGILNAFVKPIIQFLTLPFIFATYGFVIVLINTVILLLLDYIFEARFYVGGLIWALVGGLVMGVVSSFLESLLGLNLPIVPETVLPKGSSTAPAPGSRIFTNMLANEQGGLEEPASGEVVSEPAGAVTSPEPSTGVTAERDEEISDSIGDEEQALTEVENVADGQAQEDAEDEQHGDER